MYITLITTLPEGGKHYSESMDKETAIRTLKIMEPRGLKTTVSLDYGRGLVVTYPAKYFVKNINLISDETK